MIWSSLALGWLSVATTLASPVSRDPLDALNNIKVQSGLPPVEGIDGLFDRGMGGPRWFVGVVRTAAAICPFIPRPYILEPGKPARRSFPTDGDWSSHFAFNFTIGADDITVDRDRFSSEQATVPLLPGASWHDHAAAFRFTETPVNLVDVPLVVPPNTGMALAGFANPTKARDFERTGERADVKGLLVVQAFPAGYSTVHDEPDDWRESWSVVVHLQVDSIRIRTPGSSEFYSTPGRRLDIARLVVKTDPTPPSAESPGTVIRDVRVFLPSLGPGSYDSFPVELYSPCLHGPYEQPQPGDGGSPWDPCSHPHGHRGHHHGRHSIWKRVKRFFRKTVGRIFGSRSHLHHGHHAERRHPHPDPYPARCGSPQVACARVLDAYRHCRDRGGRPGRKTLWFGSGFGVIGLVLAVLCVRALFKKQRGSIKLPDDDAEVRQQKQEEGASMTEK